MNTQVLLAASSTFSLPSDDGTCHGGLWIGWGASAQRSAGTHVSAYASQGSRNCGLRLGVHPEFSHESSLIPSIHTASSSALADGMAIDFFCNSY